MIWSVHGISGCLKEMMVEEDLKLSVLEQMQLPALHYTVEPGNLPPEFARALLVRVTEVFGTAPEIASDDNYLVCGEYLLHEPVLEAMVLATSGRMTGYHQFLSPGAHPFTLYGHVLEKYPTNENVLSILIFHEGESYAVLYIRLREAS